MLVSTVAMVSAYEAHIINVTSHVENAMALTERPGFKLGTGPHYKIEFGTVFPQEWLYWEFMVKFSDSFCAWPQHRGLDYSIWVLPKPIPNTSDNYPWLGDCLYIGLWRSTNWLPYPKDATPAGNLTHVGYGIPTAPTLSSHLDKVTGPINERVVIGLDVPVFRGYYNELTDPEPKPSHRDDPTVIIEPWEDRYPDNMADGITLGAEIKVQVTKIYRTGYVTPYD